MPLFHVTFSKELDCIIEADSYADLSVACAKHCRGDDIDEWNPDDWQFSAGEMKPGSKYNGKGEPDMGVANGECLEIGDYRAAKAELAAKNPTPEPVDPRQTALPFDCTGRGCGCTPGCSGRNDDP